MWQKTASRAERSTSVLWDAVFWLTLGLLSSVLFIPTSVAAPAPPAAKKPGVPLQITIPIQKIKAPILPQVVDEDGILGIPADSFEIGWWKYSAKPGAPVGLTMLVGHSVHDGDGAFQNIRELKSGDKVFIKTKKHKFEYQVSKVQILPKEKVESDAEKLFNQKQGIGNLLLISCADWSGTYWKSNVFVYADIVSDRPEI